MHNVLKLRKGRRKYNSLGRFIYRSMKGERNSGEIHLEIKKPGTVKRKTKIRREMRLRRTLKPYRRLMTFENDSLTADEW